jgi:hypothetical protein
VLYDDVADPWADAEASFYAEPQDDPWAEHEADLLSLPGGPDHDPVAEYEREHQRRLNLARIVMVRSRTRVRRVRPIRRLVGRAPRGRRVTRARSRAPGREPDEPHPLDVARFDGRLVLVRDAA